MSDIQDPRVLFAAERTLLAWNRTSIAMIAFGFLIERSGLLINVLAGSEFDAWTIFVTMIVGLLFILLGTAVALCSAKQYAKVLKTLTPVEFPAGYSARWGIAVNIVIAILGLVLVFALLLAR